MKIAIIGHGAVGRLIEQLATDAGHTIATIIHEEHASLDAAELARVVGGDHEDDHEQTKQSEDALDGLK